MDFLVAMLLVPLALIVAGVVSAILTIPHDEDLKTHDGGYDDEYDEELDDEIDDDNHEHNNEADDNDE
jgi:hypothetical protein